MASNQEATTVPLEYWVDNENERVVLAEANGDFIDVLFSFLTLPLGTIVRLGNKFEQPVEMGSIKKLYESVQSLDPDVFWNDICKRMLCFPRNPLEASCQRLKVKVDDTDPTKYFMCHSCSTERDLLLSTFDGARCYCGKLMRKNMDLLEETAADNGVFVKGDAKFLIFDDLTVLRSSPGDSVQKFLEHRHKDFDTMTKYSPKAVMKKESFFREDTDGNAETGHDEPTDVQESFFREDTDGNAETGHDEPTDVHVILSNTVSDGNHKTGHDKPTEVEIFSILNRALISQSPLSDEFFNKKGSKPCCCSRALERLYKNLHISKSAIHWKDCIKIKVMVSKSKNEILFAEAGGDFVDFLVSFLTTPLGSILNLTNGKLPFGSIGNLYRSVKVLDPSWFTGSSKESLMNLRVAPHFGCKSSPLFQEDDTPNYWYGTVVVKDNNEGRTMISKKKDMLQSSAKQLKLFDPRSSDGAREPAVGFIKRPCLFVVSDDLEVKQLTATSSIEYLKNLKNVKLGDLEEHLVEIRSNEVMNLLMASLTSNKATLTRSLCCLLMTWKCQRFIPFWGALQGMKKKHRKKKEKGENCNILCCCCVK